jgi:hypothetical protein
MRPGWAISEGQPKTSQRSPLDYSPKDWRILDLGLSERCVKKSFSKFLRRWQMMPPPFSKKTMIQSGKDYLGKVPVEVEVTIGDTWAEK